MRTRSPPRLRLPLRPRTGKARRVPAPTVTARPPPTATPARRLPPRPPPTRSSSSPTPRSTCPKNSSRPSRPRPGGT
ncbi:hypothetical protein [Ornithinimicrobium kibberense]|uniref:hypothetical protein n=1 Tax=Ornithinimicrobium kibberense TaxID=282060 RepID=UPI00361451BD